jgi:tetratricopeptide (TPR) repeat protein
MLLGAAITALGVTGCRNNNGSVSGCPGSAEAAPIDATVMAFLSAARALHHEADVKNQSGDLAGAIGSLERLIAMPRPRANEVDEVLADTHARLAEMRLASGDLAGADRDVQAGLEHAREPTYFRGHLLEVSGLVEERRAGALSDAGKSDEAARARARAVDLLERAVKVQEQVIVRALGDGGAGD